MVVTDWMMAGGMDGVELCKRLRSTEAGRDLYILILTGQNEEQASSRRSRRAPTTTCRSLSIRSSSRQDPAWDPRHQADRGAQGREPSGRKRPTRASRSRSAVQGRLDDRLLTELPNRRYAMKRLEKEWATSERANLPLSVILLDIDHFKNVNDTYGHDVGDQVLRATARADRTVLRTSDTCTRMGGEEFLVICPGTPLEGAHAARPSASARGRGERVDCPPSRRAT
jgi:PleD family two-component response regulator